MKKQLIFAALGAIFLASCADTWDREYSGVNPQKEGYEYLAEYLPLKEYVDRAKYPNFKLGIATTASEYTKQQLVYALVNSNADETVAGNAMKMASCVDDKGNMSFDNAVAFVNAATDAGLNVYGHTLAWHAQQPNKYLNSLLADKKVEVAARAVEVRNNPLLSRAANLEAMLDLDFEDGQPFFNGWGNNSTRVVEDGALKISNPSAVNPWEAQMAHDFTEPLEVGTSYRLEFKIKGSGSGTLGAGFQNPSNYSSCGDYEAVAFDTEWKNVSITTKCNAEEGKRLIFSFGAFAGDIYIDDFKFSKEVPIETEVIMSADFNDDNPVFNGWGNNSTRVVENGVLKVTNPSAVNPWEAQMAYDVNEPFVVDQTYKMKFKVKGSAAGQISAGFQITSNYSSAGEFGAVDFTTDWQEVELTCTCNAEGATRLIFSFGAFAGDIYIDDFEFYYIVYGNSIPLTPEEKKEVLTVAMDRWIGGMMQAMEGKVKAWDVVNEAISGGNPDAEGVYALQHDNGDANNFFWQDYMGDLEYVRTAVASARKHFEANGGNPSELKLFVNDYNLESDWDQNGKLKSLIKWIERWEADGVTKIDGIGSQMHISYHANAATQESKKNAIVESFKLMANSKKLVRISELDMGYVDANGNSVPTANLTEEQHKQMAELYTFVVSKYLEIIPAAQQWGICQWAATDSPAGSGWRAGEPIGLWDEGYNRKHTYAGFAEGLAGN